MNSIVILKQNEHEYKVYFKDNNKFLGEIYQEIDGCFVWHPIGSYGCWAAYVLRDIANTLDDLNNVETI